MVIDNVVVAKVALTVTKQGGTAKFILTALSRGLHVVTTQYLGDSEFDSATSSILIQIVQ